MSEKPINRMIKKKKIENILISHIQENNKILNFQKFEKHLKNKNFAETKN